LAINPPHEASASSGCGVITTTVFCIAFRINQHKACQHEQQA
jgi:hypothetical protein